MNKVYLVTTGDYSAYTVEAVFSTEEKAQKYIDLNKRKNYSEFEIEPMVLDTYELQLTRNMKCFEVSIKRNGDVVSIVDQEYRKPKIFIRGLPDYNTRTFYNVLCVVCYAKDEKHAAKIANEKRARLIADDIWKVNNESIQILLHLK